ncbi:MAG: hypothetical protein QOI71_3962 [Gaiellales bacterium]|nr:hypothetical protein [Gaiellales bacterium]
MSELLGELAYRNAAQALSQQEAALNELRSRTGVLLAADAVTASFLGASAIKSGPLNATGVLALACFVLSIGAALFVLGPRKGMKFSLSGPVVYTSLYAERDNAEELYRRLAYWLEEFWTDNQDVVDRLYPFFTAAVVLLLLQLVLWAVALTARI